MSEKTNRTVHLAARLANVVEHFLHAVSVNVCDWSWPDGHASIACAWRPTHHCLDLFPLLWPQVGSYFNTFNYASKDSLTGFQHLVDEQTPGGMNVKNIATLQVGVLQVSPPWCVFQWTVRRPCALR